jgi:PAS domain S-box-containing protein
MSEKRFKQLMEKVTDFAIFFIDPDAIIQEWSIGAQHLFGHSRDEAIGQNAEMIFTPADRAQGVAEKELAGAASNNIAGDERWHIRKDGSFFFADGLMHALYEEGKLNGYVKIVRDLTQRVAMEAAIDDNSDALDVSIAERTSPRGDQNQVLRIEMARQQRNDMLRIRLMQRALQTQEEERKRMSRDIHDHLGQQLTGLRLMIETVKQQADGESLVEPIRQLESIAKEIDDTVDFLEWELRPNPVIDVGLEKAIENYLQQWSALFKIHAEAKKIRLNNERLAAATEINLYRIVQESLNNVAKHAKATKVEVLLENRGTEVVLIVEDNGIGFDLEKNSDRANGLGLIGMGERAAMLQGVMEIESAKGGGTSVFVRVPAIFGAPASNIV